MSTDNSKRVTLTKAQLATKEGSELAALCAGVVKDGHLSNAEIGQIEAWLLRQGDSNLPAVEFLRNVIAEAVQDAAISDRERRMLQRAIERVLPADLRAEAIAARKALSEAEKLGKGRVVQIYSKVRGLTFPNPDGSDRSRIASQLRPGASLHLVREPDNPRNSHSIKILTESGAQVGYISSDLAGREGDRGIGWCLAKRMDDGIRIECRLKQLTGGGTKNVGANIELNFWDGHPSGQPSGPLFFPADNVDIPTKGREGGLVGCGSLISLLVCIVAALVASFGYR